VVLLTVLVLGGLLAVTGLLVFLASLRVGEQYDDGCSSASDYWWVLARRLDPHRARPRRAMARPMVGAVAFCGLVVTLLVGPLSGSSMAAPGDIDPTFSAGLPPGSFGPALAFQPDGKIIVKVPGMAVYRLLLSGAPDPTFGAGGAVSVPLPDRGGLQAVTVLPDGKIVAAEVGAATLQVVRLLVDGSLDASFGSSGVLGVPVACLQAAVRCSLSDLAIESDGKIVLAGTTAPVGQLGAALLMRVTALGGLDPSFGNLGVVTLSGLGPGVPAEFRSVRVQPEGKIVAGGLSGAVGASSFVLARYTASGTLDTSFGSSLGNNTGIVTGSYMNVITTLELMPDGRIVAAGRVVTGVDPTFGLVSNITLARFQSSGALDRNFQGAGTTLLLIGAFDSVTSMAVATDGTLYVAGSTGMGSSGQVFLTKVLPDGTRDGSFANGAGVVMFYRAPFTPPRVALAPDGKLLSTGLGGPVVIRWLTAGIAPPTPPPPPPPTTVVSVNDDQFTYAGTWLTDASIPAKFHGDDHYSSDVDATYSLGFTGTDVALFGSRAPHHGIGGVSIDGGAEVGVDWYAATRADNTLLWSASLPAGNHVVTVRVTGAKNPASTGTVITADRIDITGTVTPPLPPPPPLGPPGPPSPQPPSVSPPSPSPVTGGAAQLGYWMLQDDGTVYAFGAAFAGDPIGRPSVALEHAPHGGYWVLASDGTVHGRNGAAQHGDAATAQLEPGEHVAALSGLPDGSGYWSFTDRGRAIAFGAADHFGDMSAIPLNGPVVASVATPTGHGYYMIANDGGVFAFGDAAFHGSTGNLQLNQPVVGIAPDPDGAGYWLVAADGGIFAFDATFRGSMGATPLNQAGIGAVAYGNG
jgi:uncharacterized delta-60 repeat protein